MKILVLSDSHYDYISCEAAIRKHLDVSYIIHLGDGEDDLDKISSVIRNKPVIKLRGNCSFYGAAPLQLTVNIDGVKMYLTHGALENVKMTRDILINRAVGEGCGIALYGHTHIQKYEYYDYPLHIFNPGSIKGGYYGIIDTENGKITCSGLSL